MSLDKIQLPDFLIAGLFNDTLVITDEPKSLKTPPKTIEQVIPQPQIATVAPPKKLFLGDNKKNITILVNDNQAVYLRDEWLKFLTNILAACKLNIGDVAIVNQSQSRTTFTELQPVTYPKYLITFGVGSRDIALTFSIPDYQVQDYNKCIFLLCPPLSVMFGDTEAVKLEKTKLWVSLKKMFNI